MSEDGANNVSKKEKNIELQEVEKKQNGEVVVELQLGDITLGTIKPDNKRFLALLPNGESFRVNSKSEAINLLIRDYHLHNGN